VELEEYRSAILFGYQKMDALLGEVLKMADEKTTVVLATALSQQPCLTYEQQGGKAFYRPLDFGRLFAFAGVSGYTHVAPVMAHQFQVEFESEEAARRGDERLRAMRVDGQQALRVERNGKQLFAWCQITTAIAPSAQLECDRTESFFSMFYRVDGIKSGMHHPDGLLWIHRPSAEHELVEAPVDLDLVAPTLLAELGIEAPSSMRSAVRGGFTAVTNSRSGVEHAVAV
jgi:hypothetical protein